MKRDNRKIIEDCCRKLKLEIEDLSYERIYEYIYGDGSLNGFWKLQLKNGDYYETSTAEEADYAVDQLCKELIEDSYIANRSYDASDFKKCYLNNCNLNDEEFGKLEHPKDKGRKL